MGFFSKIKGGQLDGLTFKEYFLTWDRLGLFLSILTFIGIVIYEREDFYYAGVSNIGFWGFLTFLLIVLTILTIMVLRDWKLKKKLNK